MKLKQFLQTTRLASSGALALLFLRLIMGVAFILHGWGKIQVPFGWMGPESPVPGLFQFLAAFSEFGGGIALILGLLTRVAALGLGFTMAVATYTHMVIKGDPFVGRPSYELPLVYLVISILFIVMGPGSYSADAKVFGERK